MDDETRASEEVDATPYEGKPDFDIAPSQQLTVEGQDSDESGEALHDDLAPAPAQVQVDEPTAEDAPPQEAPNADLA